ncbi:cyclin-like protein [Haematococcus lacustris]
MAQVVASVPVDSTHRASKKRDIAAATTTSNEWLLDSSKSTGGSMWPDVLQSKQGLTCTAQYGLAEEFSTDSMASEQETLVCDELLLSEQPKASCTSPALSSEPTICHHLPSTQQPNEDVVEMISNEAAREIAIAPSPMFLDQHPSTADAPGITAAARQTAISWLVEVVAEYKLNQETLFLAVSYMDRFLTSSRGVPTAMLQLVAVACLSLACKQEEVKQLDPADWARIAQQSFTCEDLVRMEWLVMDNLNWRLRTPTPYSFLHLYCFGLASCPVPTICTASFLVELALLDYSMLRWSYSTLAAAAIVAAHLTTRVPLNMASLRHLGPHLQPSQLAACCSALVALHSEAAAVVAAAAAAEAAAFANADSGGGGGLAAAAEQHGQQASASASPMEASCYEVCKKYAGVEWSQVSLYPALQPQQVLAYLAGQ